MNMKMLKEEMQQREEERQKKIGEIETNMAETEEAYKGEKQKFEARLARLKKMAEQQGKEDENQEEEDLEGEEGKKQGTGEMKQENGMKAEVVFDRLRDSPLMGKMGPEDKEMLAAMIREVFGEAPQRNTDQKRQKPKDGIQGLDQKEQKARQNQAGHEIRCPLSDFLDMPQPCEKLVPGIGGEIEIDTKKEEKKRRTERQGEVRVHFDGGRAEAHTKGEEPAKEGVAVARTPPSMVPGQEGEGGVKQEKQENGKRGKGKTNLNDKEEIKGVQEGMVTKTFTKKSKKEKERERIRLKVEAKVAEQMAKEATKEREELEELRQQHEREAEEDAIVKAAEATIQIIQQGEI